MFMFTNEDQKYCPSTQTGCGHESERRAQVKVPSAKVVKAMSSSPTSLIGCKLLLNTYICCRLVVWEASMQGAGVHTL